MAKGRIRLLSTIPGPANLGSIVREFCGKPGVITAFSDSAVRTLASLAPEGSASESLPFGGLVRRFASMCGAYPLSLAHEGHAVAAIGAACDSLPADSPFLLTARRPGLHRAVRQTLHELSAFDLDADEFDLLAARAEPALGAKLRSLGVLDRQATDSLRQLGRSFSREHVGMCLSGTLERGAELGRVLILAGSEFNPQAIDLIKWAADHGGEITVVVYRHAARGDLYRQAKNTVERLGVAAEESGSGNGLLRCLFTADRSSDERSRCSIMSAADPLSEAEWALRGCLERRQAGMRYDRMAVYIRDSDSYAPLIEASAKRLNVPLRLWRRAPLLTNSFARIALAALEFCASQDVRSIMSLARTTYIGLDFENRGTLREAVKAAHSAREDQWLRLREWTSDKGDSYDWLSRLLDWRDEAIETPVQLETWTAKLRELMMVLPPERYYHAGSERDKRAQYVLFQSINEIASVRRLENRSRVTLSEFARIAREVWEEADVSIPAAEEGALVSSHAEEIPEVDCLFVLGMLEGVFPRRRSEDPILSDLEREAISDLRGGAPLPVSRDKAVAERDEFYSVCAASAEEIVFSYPETDEDRDNVPAFYLDEVERALGCVSRTTRSRDVLTPPIEECASLSDKELCAALSEDRADSLPLRFSDPEVALGFARRPELGFQPHELREALQCPFSFFVRRTLGVQPDRLRARWFSLVRLPKAASLACSSSPEEAARNLERALEAQLDEFYSEVPAWEIAMLRSGGRRLIREWVDREFGAREIWPREGVQADVQFGNGTLRSSLPKGLKLKGGVTATSRCGPYSVVHLVETSGPPRGHGLVSSDLADPDKLYFGVHLLAAWEQGSASALEIETLSGERLLMLLPRLARASVTARVEAGLRVIDLGGADDAGGTKTFFDEVKKLAHTAARRAEEVDVQAIRGDHCTWCDYGELCRQSLEFGEEDSPFADDL